MSTRATRPASDAPRVVGLQRGSAAGPTLLQASSRLALVTTIGACLQALGLVVVLTFYESLYGIETLHVASLVGGIIISLALLFITRRGLIPERWLDAFGVAYVVVIAAAIAVLSNYVPWPKEVVLPSWSPVAVWSLAMSLVMAFRPRVAFFATLGATLTDPLTALALDNAGLIHLPMGEHVIFRFAPNILAPALAFAIASVLQRFQDRLTEIRALGAYQLTERLGKGGMGEVWRGTHHILKRDVAVKLIAPSFEAPAQAESRRQRFEREARATARLQSPHTINVYDFGAETDGTFYYVMELLNGIDLHSLTTRFGPQPAERVVHILRQVCHSLGEAHANGLVHRDVKPANVSLCRYAGECDFVKVLDFGLVKEVSDGEHGPAPTLTIEGAIHGTPAYMAPEQVLGDPVTLRTDIYGLGCIAFRLLTGRDPFEAPNATKVLFAHVQETAVSPASLSELPVPAELDAIVLRCLAKKPEERWASTAELVQALDKVPLPEPWTTERARDWWRMQLPDRMAFPGAIGAMGAIGSGSALTPAAEVEARPRQAATQG